MRSPKNKNVPLILLLGVTLALLAYPATTTARTSPLADRDPVNAAWRLAQESGVYHFATTVVETTHPAPTVANVGRSSRRQRIYLEGETDLPERALQMMLWQNGGSLTQSRDGVEVRIAGDQAYGRQIGGQWQEIDDFSGAFAPCNDLMAYLVGARNARQAGETQVTDRGSRITQYVFDFNGPAVAAYVRDQLEDHLREQGELPGGLTLDVSDQYRDAVGDGEVWIDEDGLPLRLTVHVEYPQRRNGERVEADIQTDFSNFDRQRLAAAGRPMGRLVGGLNLHRTAGDWRRAGLNIGLGVGTLGLLLLVVTNKSRKIYAAFVIAIIFSMLITPLLQSHHTYAFSRRTAAQRAKYEQRQEEQQAGRQAREELYGSNWNPHADPVQVGQYAGLQVASGRDAEPANSPLADLRPANAEEEDADPDSDDDGDGLTYAQEKRLGTGHDEKDTDGDQITDDVEVAGFKYLGGTWYLNPLDPDTNNDGLLDSQECPQQAREEEDALSPTGVCQDTDGDGTPDAFDRDNDGDGVPDRVDLSPFNQMDDDGDPFDADAPLLLQVDDLQSNKPVFVDFQLRPQNEDHLWYALNVLDWPSGDERAQIQRKSGNDSTFADVAEEGQSTSANSDNGDVRLVPMLEIEIPYKDGHYGNLPVKEGAPITRTDEITLGQWLDTDKLVPYGISVREMNDDGDLVAYVPLNLVQDETGGDRVAFAARMHYWPTITTTETTTNTETTDWGLTQKVRVVWLVHALTDHKDEDGEWELDVPQVVRAYPEEWTLTGLAVREDHGLDVAITYEDPESDEDLQYDDPLWTVARGLEASFVVGRDEDDDGERDITIAEIDARFSITNSATITERFGISATIKLETETFTYTHEDFVAHIMMTETQKVLSDTFTAYVDQGADAVTLLFSQESRARTANLDGDDDMVTIQDNQITLKLDQDAAPVQTSAYLNWGPFRYEDDEWQSYPIAEYIDKLEVRLKEVLDEYKDESNYEDILRGQLTVAKSYYLALYHGQRGLVQSGDDLTGPQTPARTDEELAEWLRGDPIEKSGGLISRHITNLARGFYRAGIAAGLFYEHKKAGDLFASIGGWVKEKKQSALRAWQDLGKFKKSVAIGLGVIAVAAVIALFVTAAVLFEGGEAFVYILNGMGVILSVVDVVMITVSVVKRGTQTVVEALRGLKVLRMSLKAGIIAIAVSVVVIWGVFVYQIVQAGTKAGSLAFNAALATTIAATVTAAILLAITAIPIVGQIIAALIFLIDAVTMFVCHATDSDNWFCDYGISGLITAGITWIIYSANLMVTAEDEERLDIVEFEQDFVDPDLGLSPGNSLVISATLENSLNLIKWKDTGYDWKALAYWWQYSDDTLASSTFDYALQAYQKDIHSGLDRGDISGDWDRGDDRPFTLVASSNTRSPLEEAGINRTLPLYLAEGFALPVQECWAFPIVIPFPPVYLLIPVCYVRTERDTGHIDLGKELYYDVFPSTLDEFYDLAAKDGGYALGWSQDTDPSFPRLKDADGDGLRNGVDDGADPDDNDWDTDDDRLSDFFEVQQGSDPQDPDSDDDGLTDREEVILGTDPLRTDTDYDGLTDREEVDGWEFVYDFAEDGSQIRTWVTADPLTLDGDLDELTDFQEKTFGFHPRVPSDPHVLTLDSQVREVDAPHLLLRLDETENASTFRDDSGYANNGTCMSDSGGDSCPSAGHYGKYGNAPHFDGTDDYVTADGVSPYLASGAISFGGWVYPEGGMGEDGVMFAFNTAGDGNVYHLGFDPLDQHFYFSDDIVRAETTAFALDQWYHVWVVIDENDDGILYVNGAPAATFTTAVRPAADDRFSLGQEWDGSTASNFFLGFIDEVLVFDRALDQAEVQEVAAGQYNTADHIVLPGDALYYRASVKNELFSRYAQGLLSTHFPAAFTEIPPEDFVLNPREEKVLEGDVDVSPAASSGVYSLTQEVDAMITDWREESDYAELLYHFTEDAPPFADSSGSQPSRDGDCDASSCPVSTSGKYGNGLAFDGTNDHVTADEVVEYLGSDALTFGAWVYPESGKSGKGAILAFDARGYSSCRVVVGYNWDTRKFYYYNRKPCNSYDWRVTARESANTFALDQWHQVMVVIDDDVGYMYVDGTRQRTFTPDLNLDNLRRLSIGRRWYGEPGKDFFRGKIDEPVIFNRVLSADEVQSYYGDPVFELPLDESEGATVFEDASAFDNDATCSSLSSPLSGGTGEGCPAAGEPGLTSNSEAALFSGDDHLSVDGSSALDLSDGDFTLSAWVYPTGGPENSDCPFWAEYWNWHRPGYEHIFSRCEDWPIAYDWGIGGPGGGVQTDDFWIRIWGTFYFEEGDYTFTASHDDEIYVKLDGKEIIQNYDVGTDQVTRHLEEGWHRFYISYDEEFGSAHLSFDWSPAPAFDSQGILGTEDDVPADSYPTIQRVDNNEARISFKTSGGDTVELATGADVLRSYRWNHLVATYDGQYYELYANGVEVGEVLAGDAPASNAALEIGRTSDDAQVSFDKLKVVKGGDRCSGGEYVLEFKDGDGSWQQIWKGTGLFAGDVVDLNINESFQESAKLRVTESDATTDDGCCGGMYPPGSCSIDGPSDEQLGTYQFSAATGSVRDHTETFQTGSGNWDNQVEITWDVTPDGIPFRGKIDQVTIYKRAFDAGEVSDLYDAGTMALSLPLDDPPGSTEFADALDQSTGTCTGDHCPTVGVPGRDNWALRFDGQDDYVKINEANTGDLQELTVAAWVKPLSLPSGEIMRFVTLGDEKVVLRYDDQYSAGSEQLHFYMNVDDALHSIRVDNALQADTWYHVAGTYNSETMTLYLNGQQIGSGLAVTGTVGGGGEVRLSHSTETLDGLLDEVTVYRRALSADEIAALYGSAPQLLLHLDETGDATQFRDESGNDNHGTCSGNTCPQAGAKGQLGLSADFDGHNDYIQVPHDVTLMPDEELTLAVWVKMTDSDVDQKIVGKTNAAHDRGYVLGIQDGRLYPEVWDSGGTRYYTTCGSINAGYWTHLALTWDTGGDMVAYINGERACNVDASSNPIGATDGRPLRIGVAPWSTSSFRANGRIDHVTLYQRALSPREMRALFRLQAKWIEERQSTGITVDAEAPTSVLESDDVYRPNQDVVLLVSAADGTSRVTMVELGVRADGDVTYTWQSAPRCVDSSGDAVWCPTFEPTIGEGRYQLQTRATDVVGNVETPSQTYVFLVDDTPPDPATAITDGQLIDTTPRLDATWTAPLSGTVGDPDIAGTSEPGSGVDTVLVRLTATSHPTDTLIPQQATLNGSDWSVDYSLPYADATGTYTLAVQAGDEVGNAGEFVTLATVGLDTSPPVASVALLIDNASSVTRSITTTLTLTGLVTETGVVSAGVAGVRVGLIPAAMAGMSRTVGMFHLDEPSGAARFASDTGNAATCEGNSCPTAGVNGMWGTALSLDGTDDYVVADFVSENITDTQGFSFGAWVYPNYNPDNGVLLAFNAADGGNRNQIYHDDYGFRYYDGDVTTPSAYVWKRWAHVMVTIDEDGNGVLYVDAVAEETFTTSVRPDPNGRFSIGQEWDGDVTSQFFDGMIDEVTVYDRALTAEDVQVVYADAALSDSGNGVISTTWAYTVPNTLDGVYQLNLRPGDVFSNTGERSDWPAWNGEIDTAAPRVEATAEEYESYLSVKTTYTCRARDFNLIQSSEDHPADNFKCYCQTVAPHATVYTRTYYHEVSPWYADTFTDTGRLYELLATCTVLGPAVGAPDATMKACDTYGHCATAVPPSSEILAYELIDSAVLTPTQNAIITSTTAISLTGRAYASHSLKTVQVLVDGVPIDTHLWATPGVTNTQWASTWTPPFEGHYILNSRATDHNDDPQPVEHPIEVIVDVLPPFVDISPLVLTTTHRLSQDRVALSGHATDTNGLDAVQVSVDGDDWQDASFYGGEWHLDWYLGEEPAMRQYTVTARATDVAGHTTPVTQTVTVDLERPNPITLTLSSGGEVVTPSTVLTTPALLDLTWITSASRADLLPYEVVWTIHTTQTNQVRHPVPTTGPFSSTYPAGEAQRIVPSVVSRFADGNRQVDAYGGVYVDGPLTPDYITLETARGERRPYLGWMDSGCTQIGVDRRTKRNAPGSAAIDDLLKLYATWDSEALRLVWTGANWDYAGDLFIYLDTALGGAVQAFNPFTGTGVVTTGIEFPANLNFGADSLIWVEDADTAHFLTWNSGSEDWDISLLSPNYYRFDEGLHAGHTDLYLPFDLIGVTNPLTNPLALIAFATEEDPSTGSGQGMSLWGTMPPANPVNSERVVETLEFISPDEEHTFALTHAYVWPVLAPGICPNLAYGDADVQVGLTADPLGSTYSFLGNDLFWLWEDLFDADRPPGLSEGFTFMDVDHPPVGDGDTITYTLHYINRGTDTAPGVNVLLTGLYALRFSANVTQVVSLGSIAPGEQGTATFQGQIDLEAARTDYYTPCLSAGNPITCEQYLDWAALAAYTYDASLHPLDWSWADHRVDGDPPEFFDIQQPELFVSAGSNTMRGYAYDESGVPTLTLGVESPAGTTVCPDSSPDDGRWSCQWDATAANGGTPPSDGDQFNLRLLATDGYAQSSVWTGWRTFIADTVPPSVTFSAGTTHAYSETVVNDASLTFNGVITDNRGIAGVEVCVDSENGVNECGSADVQAVGEVTRIYTDAQSSPIVSTTVCGGGEIARTFVVTDSFTVGEVRLGLNADHARRNDISATLTSPAGTSVWVLGPKAGEPPDDQNYDVLLYDAATSSLHEFKGNDDTAAPHFDREARPADPMRVFRGEDSAGPWTLALCDTTPITHHGVYSHSQLVLKPQNTASQTGNWFYTVAASDEMDGITHTLQAYAMDLVGNRSDPITLTFEIDNVAPTLAVTATVELTATTPNRPSVRVLAGTASDGGRIVQMYAFVRTPDGDLESRRIGRSDAGWWFDLAPGATGDYVIWVNAMDAAGNVTTIGPSTVTVIQVVATNDGPTILGASTTLTATVMGDDGYDFVWNLGDNTIVSGYQLTMTQHVYPDVGTHTVVVTASKGADTFTAITTVVVDEAIAGLSAANDSPTVLGNVTTLTATLTAGSNVSYTWNLGDGELRRGMVVAHAYPSTGTYTATVTAENSVSVFTATTIVTSVCTDVQSVSITGPTTALSGTAITLYAFYLPDDATGVTLAWDNGTIGASAAYTWTELGVRTIVVTATAPCGDSVTATHSVTVTTDCTPVSSVSIDGPTRVPSGTAVTLSASYLPADATGVALLWNNGTTGPNAEYAWPEGIHTVVVTATDACGNLVTDVHTVTSVCTDVQSVSISGPLYALAGMAATFYASYTPADALAVTLSWDNGATGASAEYTWTEEGIHTIVVTATGACGDPVTGTYTVIVTTDCVPVVSISIDGPTDVPSGVATPFTASYLPANATGVELAWDNSAGGPIAEYTWMEEGIHTVVVTATDACGFSATDTHPVNVEHAIAGLSVINDSPTPLGQFTTLTATVTAAGGETLLLPGDGYAWAFGDGETGSGAVVTHTYPFGIHTAIVTASNSVSSLAAATTVTVTGVCTPVQSVSIDGSTDVLSGTVVTLNASYIPTDATAVTLEWDNGTVGASAEYTWPEGVYTVVVTATAACDDPVFATHTVTVVASRRVYLPLVMRSSAGP